MEPFSETKVKLMCDATDHVITNCDTRLLVAALRKQKALLRQNREYNHFIFATA